MTDRKYDPPTHCQCGRWSGFKCEWHGPRSTTVVVEWMPLYARQSHIDAGGIVGVYPHNDAQRLRVSAECAEQICEAEGDWAWKVAKRAQSPDTPTKP